MKNTKQNILKLLEELKKHAWQMADIFENEQDELYDKVMSEKYKSEATAYFDVIQYLTNERYFNAIWNAVFKKGE